MCVAGQQVCGQDMCSWLAGGVCIQGVDSRFKNITMVHCSVYVHSTVHGIGVFVYSVVFVGPPAGNRNIVFRPSLHLYRGFDTRPTKGGNLLSIVLVE